MREVAMDVDVSRPLSKALSTGKGEEFQEISGATK